VEWLLLSMALSWRLKRTGQSQVRITIERALGIFVRRFSMFWKPLQFRLQLVTKIVEACSRLHNCCISHNISDDSTEAHALPLELALTEMETLQNSIYAHGTRCNQSRGFYPSGKPTQRFHLRSDLTKSMHKKAMRVQHTSFVTILCSSQFGMLRSRSNS
jgi:hypothetical protein